MGGRGQTSHHAAAVRRHIAHRQSRRLITSGGAGGRRRIEKEKKKRKEEEEAGEVLRKVVFSRPAGSPAHPTRSPTDQHHLFVLGPTSLKVQLTSPLTDSGFSLLLLPPPPAPYLHLYPPPSVSSGSGPRRCTRLTFAQ